MARRLASGLRARAEKRTNAHARSVRSLGGRVVRRGGTNRKRVEAALAAELDELARQAYRGWRRVVTSTTGTRAPRDLPDPDRLSAAVEAAQKGATWRERVQRGELTTARVRTLAASEANRLNNLMRDLAVRDVLGAADRKVVAWVYVHTHPQDASARPHHVRRNGRRFRIGQRRIPLPDGPNCLCVYLPVWGKR